MITIAGYQTHILKTDNNWLQSYKIPFPVHSDTRRSKATYTRPFTLTNKVHRKSIVWYT